MTVGIAAMCEQRRTLVLATDKMVSFNFAEGELDIKKMALVHPRWIALISGGDIGAAIKVLSQWRIELHKMPKVEDGEEFRKYHEQEEVVAILERGYQKIRLDLAVGTYLTPRGRTLDEWRQNGRALYGEIKFVEIDRSLQEFHLDCSFIVAGFAERAHIFEVSNPGIARSCSIPGFCANGIGFVAATSSLLDREMSPEKSLVEALYCVYEAKVEGERAASVGINTDLVIFREEGNVILSKDTEKVLERIRKRLAPRDLNDKDKISIASVSEISESDKRRNRR